MSLAIAMLAIAACTSSTGPTAPGAAASAAGVAPLPPRGGSGALRIRWLQQVTNLNSYLGVTDGDFTAASLVLEPLANLAPDGRLVPILATEIPTVENGGMAGGQRSLTWKLRPNVKWSDGSAFTSADVVFTWKYLSEGERRTREQFRPGDVRYQGLARALRVEAVDAHTVKVTYTDARPELLGGLTPRAALLLMFGGHDRPILQERQFADFVGAGVRNAPGNQRPIGTGPYQVKELRTNDVVTFDVNVHYRDPARPFFSEIVLKTSGDALSAARAVFQTGEADLAFGVHGVSADQLRPLIDAPGSKGVLVTWPLPSVERVSLNRADPDPALGDKRSEPDRPHPFLGDLRVRRALAMAVDRNAIVQLWGGLFAEPTCNLVLGIASYTSPNTARDPACTLDPAAASRLLDEAGWTRGADGVRQKAGQRLRITLATTIDARRQRIQDVLKEAWAKLGIETELTSAPSGVFFTQSSASGTAPGAVAKFFSDAQLFTNSHDPDPTTYLGNWTTAEIRTRAANWAGSNYERWSNSEYDRLHADLLNTSSRPDERDRIIVRMNDMLVGDVVVIPLFARKEGAGFARDVRGFIANSWATQLWNIADWRR